MNITGYTSGYQRDKAIDSYKDSLSIKARLNDIYENVNVETSKNKKYNITPISQTKSAEEEIGDLTLQNEKAMTNLKKMLKIDDAGAVLDKLRTGNELVVFNRFFNQFEKDVGNQSNLTPTAYYQLWERYKEKLLASGTTGIFIPSQKADIDALIGRIDTLITSSGLTDAEVNKVSKMVEFMYESGMNKQIEAIYKMLNTKKEYERLVRETKIEREDIAREKKKWKADIDGVLSGLIEAENEAKASKEPNRFAVLSEFKDVIDKIDKSQKELQLIDETIVDLELAYENGYFNDKEFNDKVEQLHKARKNNEEIKSKTENMQIKIYRTKDELDKAFSQGNISDIEYYEAIDNLGKKPKKERGVVDEFLSSAKAKKPSAEKLRRGEEFKEEMSRFGKEKEESKYIKKIKVEKEKQRKEKEKELSEEALLEQFYEESGAKARAEEARLKKEQEKKQKKLSKTMKGLKAQSYTDIEKARLSRVATDKFKNVIDEINSIIQMGGTNLLSYKKAEDILQNSPVHSRRASEQLDLNLNKTIDDLVSQMTTPKSEVEQKQAEEVINDTTSDIISNRMLKELEALETMKMEQLGEAKSQVEADKIIEDVENSQQGAINYYTSLMQQVESQGKQKIITLSSKSEHVFKGALKAGEVEVLETELNALDEIELRKRAVDISKRTSSYSNPSYGYMTHKQTFNAKTNRKHKLIAYIIYQLTGQEIPKIKGGRIYRGRGVESAKDKYYEFGNYLIHVPQLEKGFLSLKYPSEGPVKEFPKAVISSDFIHLLYEIINTKKFNTIGYDKLDDPEKELFDRLITFAKISRNDIDNMSKHRKITDKQRDIDIKRFNILKGEIVAGNDNPNVIKEMKALLIKLYDEKVIGKADFNRIMQNLVYLS